MWHKVYNKLAAMDRSGELLFINYGYAEESDQDHLDLQPHYEPHRYAIQLYNHVIDEIDVKNKDLLEIGCGRGGGGAFILSHKQPRTFTGVDLSETAIKRCAEKFPFNNARWLQGSADKLPISDQNMDVVLNVESSHCYPCIKSFLSEVKRILRPNGYLALCDLRAAKDVKILDHQLRNSGLQVIHRRIITPQVQKALDLISSSREAMIRDLFPRLLVNAAHDFFAVKGSSVYQMLKSGELVYLSYVLKNT